MSYSTNCRWGLGSRLSILVSAAIPSLAIGCSERVVSFDPLLGTRFSACVSFVRKTGSGCFVRVLMMSCSKINRVASVDPDMHVGLRIGRRFSAILTDQLGFFFGPPFRNAFSKGRVQCCNDTRNRCTLIRRRMLGFGLPV